MRFIQTFSIATCCFFIPSNGMGINNGAVAEHCVEELDGAISCRELEISEAPQVAKISAGLSGENSQANTVISIVTAQSTTQEQLPSKSVAEASFSQIIPDQSSAPSIGNIAPIFASKRGIAYNDASLANILSSACGSCSGAYNWGANTAGLNSRLSFVPMLWGDTAEYTNPWESLAKEAIRNGAKALMSFNEPDNANQSNISPGRAAHSHIRFMNPYANEIKLGAPAISNSNKTMEGPSWLRHFVKACGGKCKYDFCSVHWYSSSSSAKSLFDLLQEVYEICDENPIWLTEFAPSGSTKEIKHFVSDWLPRLDNLQYVQAYSYFMASTGSLLADQTHLSDLGEAYANT